jgi:hypothetical protein
MFGGEASRRCSVLARGISDGRRVALDRARQGRVTAFHVKHCAASRPMLRDDEYRPVRCDGASGREGFRCHDE